MKAKLKAFLGALVVIVGFIASVTGILSWLGLTLHLGNIIVPNPILIIVAFLITIALVVAAFYLGGVYIIYLFMNWLTKLLLKHLDLTQIDLSTLALPATLKPETATETVESQHKQESQHE